MKKLWTIFLSGLIALIPIFVIAFVIKMLFNVFVVFNVDLVTNPIINSFINLTIWLLFIFLIGLALTLPSIRCALKSLLAKIPLISSVSNFLDNRHLEHITQGDFPVVMCQLGEDAQCFGIITGMEYENRDGQHQTWFIVFIPTVPVPLTGFIVRVTKSRLVERSDLKVQDVFRLATSFGTAFGTAMGTRPYVKH